MSSTTFAFGKNWLSYVKAAISQEKIDSGRTHFRTLCEGISMQDKSFLDIGFGQGLALYYAGELGAPVTGIDPDSDNLLAAKRLEIIFWIFRSRYCCANQS
jgi:2-polyprenyl-3-methyl-5-hydroxy-6-metoxy-1,4-benzoquinol methylase